MLVNFLNIERGIIKAQLHLYENMDIGKEEKFWRGIKYAGVSQTIP